MWSSGHLTPSCSNVGRACRILSEYVFQNDPHTRHVKYAYVREVGFEPNWALALHDPANTVKAMAHCRGRWLLPSGTVRGLARSEHPHDAPCDEGCSYVARTVPSGLRYVVLATLVSHSFNYQSRDEQICHHNTGRKYT